MASETTLLGAAGEHYVMCELLRRGYIAALAPTGVPNADIVVTDISGGRLCSLQVKTRRDIGSDKGWHMKSKHESIVAERLFYCFIDFGRSPIEQPRTFIVPSETVAKVLRDSHAKWLATPGKNGRAHQDGVMRRFMPDYERVFGKVDNPYPSGWLDAYRDAWHLLKLSTQDVEAAGD